ncbi:MULTISPECIES: DUF3231 family protein [unclassified Bacillus (in: firmicutes)]|uniref:DUF3231 family protein n=1 Tax=unclassified Bacillus (in: firmicutes) TaxID=185979 RepID=UPI0020C8BDD8|nr:MULTISPECIES: DUF3231 family protein [unclassified Bacillus (in: firmicutes)]
MKNLRSVFMGILSGNPQNEPLHYGEVFGAWSYLLAGKAMVAGYQTLLNHTGDGDLKKLLEDVIDAGKTEAHQLEELLKANGVGLPPTPPDRPAADLESIPVGARFADPEVSAAVSADLAAGLVTCSQIIGQSIREDVAAMFGQFHLAKAQLGAKFLKLNKEKGWLIPPPLHLQKTEK